MTKESVNLRWRWICVHASSLQFSWKHKYVRIRTGSKIGPCTYLCNAWVRCFNEVTSKVARSGKVQKIARWITIEGTGTKNRTLSLNTIGPRQGSYAVANQYRLIHCLGLEPCSLIGLGAINTVACSRKLECCHRKQQVMINLLYSDLISACSLVLILRSIYKTASTCTVVYACHRQHVPEALQAGIYETKLRGTSLTIWEYINTCTSCVVTVRDNIYSTSSLQHISFIIGLRNNAAWDLAARHIYLAAAQT